VVVDGQLAALARYGDVVEDPRLWLETALAHDFKPMAIERVSACACGATNSISRGYFIYWNLLGIRECLPCGMVYVSPRLTAGAMRTIFETYYFDLSNPEYWDSRREPIFAEVVGLLRTLGCRKIFDVGAAYGHFLKHATEAGFEAAGCDIAARAVEWGRSNLGVDIRHGDLNSIALPEMSFDAVVSLDELYYSTDPVASLRVMAKLLRPGGYVVLRLRNGSRLAGRIRGRQAGTIGDAVMPSAHLWAFTPRSVRAVLERAGFIPRRIEAAAYSRRRLGAPLAWAAWLNRTAGSFLPVMTQNFNVVAQRAD
jgi:SAM-dependent methyltransferase